MTNISHLNDCLPSDDLLEMAQIGTWEVELSSMTITWSKITRAIHEVNSDFEITFERATSFYKNDCLHTLLEAFDACTKFGKPYDLELNFTSAKNNQKWVRAIGKAIIEDGVCVKISGLFQDITEKTKNLKKIALREEQWRKTFDFSGIGMAIVSLEGNWLKVNTFLCDMFGYKEEEFISKNFNEMTHPDDKTIGLKLIKQLLNKDIDYAEIEKRYISKNGDIIWALLNVSLVRDDKDEPMHFVSQINNITANKLAASKIQSLLDVTTDQNARLLNFAHIVSHNLKSHSGNLVMLLDLMEHEDPEAAKNSFFPLIGTAVGHLRETVNNLNEIAFMNTKIHDDLSTVRLYNAIEKTLFSVKAIILDTKATIINEVPDGLKIKTIPAYLDSIILNFLSNALKYKKENVRPIVTLKTRVSDEYIIIDIKDNGLGIDLKRHGDKLFGMYNTFHKHKDSRGLGLFITKNQIEAIGGKIKVDSEINVGTTFSLYLKNNYK
ncbi:sensor histidine kinase [Psychroserpens damuponensis]|uniref:sensor histidine kinase n=1 Tax=Psychroserpens damuponensis TaxID=943936 RepID=UPI000A06E04D|nr:HAMP domain-containing sensor histidine kinase [Psychroserpens damuponensis]